MLFSFTFSNNPHSIYKKCDLGVFIILGRWSGGKGSVKRKATHTDKQANAKGLGCGWCEYYFALRKKCTKPKDERCPKENE